MPGGQPAGPRGALPLVPRCPPGAATVLIHPVMVPGMASDPPAE